MGWVRIEDDFAWHPKVLQAGPLGMALYVAGLCYSNRYLTDGFIPAQVLPSLIDVRDISLRVSRGELVDIHEDAAPEMIAEALVDVGLWEEVDGGYQIHDYLQYQPSREQVMREREKARQRMARVRADRSSSETDPVSGTVRANDAGSSGEVRANVWRSSDNPNPNPIPNPTPIPNNDQKQDLDQGRDGRGVGEPTQRPPAVPAAHGESSGKSDSSLFEESGQDATPQERAILHELRSVPRYPFDYAEDLAFIRRLAVDYPSVDLLAEVKRWRDWLSGKPPRKSWNPRLRFRNWCEIAAKRARDAPRPARHRYPVDELIEEVTRRASVAES